MPTRKEQAAQAKGRLMQAAKDLITREGYDKVTIADITRACDMSVGNFYHYFKSKGELVTVMEREPYEHTFEVIRAREDADTGEKLLLFLQNWARLVLETHTVDYIRQWYIYHVSTPTELNDPENKINIAVDEVCQILRGGVERGELRAGTPVDALARGVGFVVFGADLYYAMTNGGFNEVAWSREYYDTFIRPALAPYLVKK